MPDRHTVMAIPAACNKVVASAATMMNWFRVAGLCWGGFIFLLVESGDGWDTLTLSGAVRATEQEGRAWRAGGGLAAGCKVGNGTREGRERGHYALHPHPVIVCNVPVNCGLITDI